jgi:hypothetical protein
MSAGQTFVKDGQFNWSRGMDSSLVPTISDPTSVRVAVNVTFRGGRAKTRPGFQQIFLTDDPDGPGSLALFSTGRDASNAKVGNYFQGSFFYVNKTDPAKSCLIAVVGGHVFRIRPVEGYVYRLSVQEYNVIDANGTFRMDATRRVYFCQVEKFLVIQNGLDSPLVWDGEVLYRVGTGSMGTLGRLASIPIGTYMAYGQGRLFVVNPKKDSFTASDLVYGGSTDQMEILSSAQSPGSGPAEFTFPYAHGFQTGDVVTISGHSSTPDLNGTWRVTATGSTTLTIPASIDSPGSGGFAKRANSGREEDVLRFTETTYLNEGGSFQIPSQMGQIRGMAFQPIGDTATGQGDLLVFGEQGTASFAVANPRESWKSTPAFQRVVLSNIGLVSDLSIVPVNNDLFFRSIDGLRTYRNARSQADGYNLTPVSAEMDAILDFDTEGLLGASSAVYFDNRLLFTVSPRENYVNIQDEPIKIRPVSFQGLGVLDFNSMGTSGQKRDAVFDGVWTGLDILQLNYGVTKRLPRCFIFTYDTDSNSNALWETYPWALFDFPLGASSRKIKAMVETRAYDFGDQFSPKKLERGDLWIGELAGETLVNSYWRPDENPCWFPWHTFTTCSGLETCIESIAETVPLADAQTAQYSGKTVSLASSWKLNFLNPSPYFYLRQANTRGVFTELSTIVLPWAGLTEATLLSALQNAGMPVLSVTRFSDEFTVTFSTLTEAIVALPAKQSVLTPGCGDYAPANIRDQYRSQIRLPSPSNDCVTSTGTLARVGHSFQFRFEWEGQFSLSKIMFIAQRLIDPVGGASSEACQ